tara:strand:- start:144 stop:314 length:171 start_codon:yes stop_codon:yes gene_type:complete
MTLERAKNIIKMLDRTIENMTIRNEVESSCSIMKSPRAKKSDLIKKRKQIKTRYKL